MKERAKTKAEIEVELVKVRGLLARLRARADVDEDDTSMLYGAQQALIWMLGRGGSPSDLQDLIEDLAEVLPP